MNPTQESALLESVARLAGAERIAFLDEVCRGDPGLRQRLEVRLAARAETERSVPAGANPTTFRNDDGDLAAEAVGRTLGRYKLLEKIGEGGCGEVYVAEQTEPVRRRVALKVIKLGMDTRDVIARFEAERQALAMMDHPNIARVLDAGTTRQGRPFFVMELVHGIPLTSYCDQADLGARARLDLFIKVCNAIQHAHQKGIIHRDIKPSNILVSVSDGAPVPKVIDFGIAKATEGRLTDATVYTQLHQFMGTPAYMSPEQAEMTGLDIDTRSDIYSLGVLLYELLTGRTPFDSRELMASGLDAMRRTIRDKEPPRPSVRLIQVLGAIEAGDLPAPASDRQPPLGEAGNASRRLLRLREALRLLQGDLDWIVMKCLEKDRTRRYDTANGLAADLKRHLDNEPVVARPPTLGYSFQKAWRRNWLLFTAGATVTAALVFGIAVSTWQAVVAGRARSAEKEQRVAAQRTATELRESLYALEMIAAFQAWKEGRIVRARELLEKQRPEATSGGPDLRSFDWGYLSRLSGAGDLFSITNAALWKSAVSPDGRMIAGCIPPTLILWNVATRRPSVVLATNTTGFPFAIGFSPDGRCLALGDSIRPVVQLWDVDRRVPRLELTNLTHLVLGLAFSPDGKKLVTAGGTMYETGETAAGEVKLWDVATGSLLGTLPEVTACAYAAAFSRDGGWIAASGAGDGVVGIWQVHTRKRVATLPRHNGYVWAMAFSNNGQYLATADEGGYVWLWDWETRAIRKVFRAHERPIYDVSFLPDDGRLLTASRDRTARLWRLPAAGEPITFSGHEGGVMNARLLPDRQTIVTGGQDSQLKFWAVQDGAGASLVANQDSNGADISFGPRGQFLMRSGRYGGTNLIAFLDPVTGSPVRFVRGHNAVASADGRIVFLRDSRVVFLDPATWEETGSISCGKVAPLDPVVSPDGRWVAVGCEGPDDYRIVIMDPSQQRENRTLELSNSNPPKLAAGLAGKLLVATGPGATAIHIWETSGWREIAQLPVAHDFVQSLAVSPDGTVLAVGDAFGLVQFWNLSNLGHSQAPAKLSTGAYTIWSLAFSPDGKTLAVGTLDGSIRLWNLPALQEVFSLVGHSSYVGRLTFSPDGQFLASTSYDHVLRLWRAAASGDSGKSEASVMVPPRRP